MQYVRNINETRHYKADAKWFKTKTKPTFEIEVKDWSWGQKVDYQADVNGTCNLCLMHWLQSMCFIARTVVGVDSTDAVH